MYPTPYPHPPMYGYDAPIAFGQHPQGQGSAALQGLGYLLGGLGSGAASAAVADPQVQAALTDLKDQCQVRAKEGVTEWMKEHWPALAFGALALVVGNYITVSIALLQAGVRGKRLKALGKLGQ